MYVDLDVPVDGYDEWDEGRRVSGDGGFLSIASQWIGLPGRGTACSSWAPAR